MRVFVRRGLLCFLLLGLVLQHASGQSAVVRGFVTDLEDGESLQGVNIVLDDEANRFLGTVTDNDGVYAISSIPPGRYILIASYIGYETRRDTLVLRRGEVLTLNIALSTGSTEMDEVVVEADMGGAARVTAGLQTVRPQDIELVPAPDVSGDLATYLTTLPGVVSIGDRGGQLFIRGGEPSHNMVLLDGMYVHQPFHILGFYSALPADIINRADVYAGGYGSKFNGRISSVIDVYTRNGNKRRLNGSFSLAPFVSSAVLEGPLIKDRVSFLGSFRQSVIEQGASLYVSEDLPYNFGDVFGKVHAVLSDNHQLSFSMIQTHDRGTLGEPTVDQVLDEIRWKNEAYGLRYLFFSGSKPFLGELVFSVSRMNSELGPEGAPIRSSRFNNFHYAVNFTNFLGITEWNYGIFTRPPSLEAELGGLYQDLQLGIGRRHKLGLYLEPDIHFSDQFKGRIGIVAQYFTGDEVNRFIEPRVRLLYERNNQEFSLSMGRYHQEVLGLNDRRDAANVFTVWTSAPSEELTEAWHGVAGYHVSPLPGVEVAAEVFYKWFSNIFISEWTAFPRFTTRLQPAEGQAMGMDLRIEVRRQNFYGFMNYGLSSVEYEAKQASIPLWYGVETLKFRPPHDRRHQFNILASTVWRGFEISGRWNFGSGLPYNRVVGFDGFVLQDGVQNLFEVEDRRRVIYEAPYRGILPTYHRLDISLERTFDWDRMKLTAQAGVINVYNRRNLLSLDIFTFKRSDQLPIIPTLGVKIEFD